MTHVGVSTQNMMVTKTHGYKKREKERWLQKEG